MRAIKRALISVSDKRGIVEFARRLHACAVEILSTGGTARLLREGGLPVTEVSDYTGFPEMMEGRLKTLHPKIHGGLLGRPGRDDAAMAASGIAPIDMVVVNLYPFEQTIARSDCTLADAVEQIDIGGPTMIRAAAKNHEAVAAVVDSADYGPVTEELQARGGALGRATRFRLAVKAFEHTARYDGAIANYLGTFRDDGARGVFPRTYNSQFIKIEDLRYGENPHQRAAFYRDGAADGAGVAGARQVQGKALSFNNIADADTALECVSEFAQGPACVIVKHANPCGVALGATLAEAYRRAYRTDPVSAFGGVIAFNGALDAAAAHAILEQQFVEVIIAPGVAPGALPVLAAKPNVRVLACAARGEECAPGYDLKQVSGGLLVQDRDRGRIGAANLKTVTRRAPEGCEIEDLLFAWRVAKFVKSNAIVYGKDGMTIGIGAGQMSRVYSARIAALKAADAGLEVAGSVMASDAFFPFRDGLDSAAAAGVSAVIQPGGSQRDREVIAAADEHGIAMVFTGMRHFRH